jgi:hypothetical protein
MNFNEFYFKENDDAYYDTFEIFESIITDVIDDFRNREAGEKQKWNVLNLFVVKRIWTDFVTTGRIKDTSGMEKIADLVIKNIGKLYANTVLSKHTEQNPEDDYGISDEELYDESDGKLDFVDYIDDGYGQMRISDYAMQPLLRDAVDLMGESEPEKMILIVDRIFNRIHQRSDISKFFINGGNKSLDRLSGKIED